MLFEFPLFSSIYAAAAVLTLLSAVMVIWRRASPGSLYFALSLLSLSFWSFASIFESGALSVSGKMFSSVWQYVGITTLGPLWLFFCAEYSGYKKILESPYRHLVWIIPFITLGLVITNNYHGLIWREILLPEEAVGNIADYQHGFFFFVFTINIYLSLLIGNYWLVRKLASSSREKRTQVIILVSLVGVGWVANILYQLGITPIQGLDLTPLSFAFIGLVFTWFIYRKQLFDLVPIARSIMMDNMTDGVIVLDDNGRVVDINQAAIGITQYQGGNPIGLTIWEMFADYLPIISHLQDQTDLQVELEMPTHPPKYLDVKIDSIGENKGQGQVITIRDVTPRKKIEIEERDQRQFAEALTEITAVLNSSLNQDEVLDRILESVSEVVAHDTVNISLVDEQGILHFEKLKGYEKYGTHEIVLGFEARVEDLPNMKRMAETGSPSINLDTRADPEWVKDLPGAEWIRSYIGAPIISGGELLGFISLDSDISDFFRIEQMYRLQAFANQAAIAIRNAQLYEEMEHLAITDSLTGLYNRRYFFAFAEKEIAQSKRYQKDLSMVMMDIDHFKRINDRFGHQVGDQVLKNVADICLTILREADIMCRFGGEEFLVLMPETGTKDAEKAAKRMRQAISDMAAQVNGDKVMVTLSIGVAELDKEHDTLDSLLFAADKALYKAKAAGRDCVRVFD